MTSKKRRVIGAGLGLAMAGLLAFPAAVGAAEREADRSRDEAPVDVRPTDVRPTDVKPTDVKPTDVKPTDAKPSDVRPTDVKPTDVRPDVRPDRETLRLHCAGRSADNGRAAVACEWSPTANPRAAGYVLVRSNGDVRTVVFRTTNLRETAAIDADIRVGAVYSYSILVVNDAGETIGSGGPVKAGVKADRPDVQILDLACELHSADRPAVACKWSEATSPPAAGYQLWRLVDRGEREQVWRGGLDVRHHVDPIPADAHRVLYAVLAVDGDGHIVGRSRPVAIRVTDDPGPDVRPVATRFRSSGRYYI